MATKNSTILNKIYLNGTNDYQQRMPVPTQSRISQTMKRLMDPMNGDLYNQFIDSYINLIGQQRIHTREWTNPLSVFKGPALYYGTTIQEAAARWVKAHTYDDASETLLKMERPEFQVFYHSMNRQDRYDISIAREEVAQAFRDEYGLNRLINAIMAVPQNSDNYDEYNLMMQLMAEYEQRWGFFKHHISAFPTDEATGKEMLTALRTYAKVLKFPSALYNGAGVDVPVFANPDELVLIIDAKASASIDVNTLAGVFQLDKADVTYRTIEVPEIPVPGAVALLTTDAFFVVNDVVYQTASFYNPENLTTKYYLHHWEVVSASPFVPAILFTTEAGTTVPDVTMTPTGFTLTASPAAYTIGDDEPIQLIGTLAGTVSPDGYGVEVAPDSFTWELSAERTVGEGDTQQVIPVQLTTRTYVDRLGRLHVQESGIEAGDTITVTGTSTYINPNGTTNAYTDDVVIAAQNPA